MLHPSVVSSTAAKRYCDPHWRYLTNGDTRANHFIHIDWRNSLSHTIRYLCSEYTQDKPPPLHLERKSPAGEGEVE
jgi:hypothetical protein